LAWIGKAFRKQENDNRARTSPLGGKIRKYGIYFVQCKKTIINKISFIEWGGAEPQLKIIQVGGVLL